MTIRTTSKTITFNRPFCLKGVDRWLPPGDYRVVTDEELIEGLSFPFFSRNRAVECRLEFEFGRRGMKYLMALFITLLVPTAAVAKGECKEDRQKFCKDVIEAKGDVGACLNQHMTELSEACKTQLEAKAKKKNADISLCFD